ncbi:hypothetical protein ACFL2O_07010 [Thermodesulfobacteriota bacterium]
MENNLEKVLLHMFLNKFDQISSEKLEKIFMTFFGCSISDCPTHVLISPIGFLLNRFENRWPVEVLFRGWWPFKITSKSYALVKVPQHAPVSDAVIALTLAKKNIYFIGLCGSINTHFQIGDIVVPRSVKMGAKVLKNYKLVAQYPTVTTMCVNNFLDQDYTGVQNEFQVVDMESFYVLKYGNRPKIFLIVSDRPLVEPFYEIGNRIYEKMNLAVDALAKYLEGEFRNG